MKLIYTKNFTVDTDGVLIRRAKTVSDTGDNVIPVGISVRAVRIDLVNDSDQVAIAGTQDSEWITQRAGEGWSVERCSVEDFKYFYIRAIADTVSVNLAVEG